MQEGMTKRFRPKRLLTALGVAAAFAAAVAFFSPAQAEITIGVSISGTGPGASLGIPIRNTFGIIPKTIAGQPVKVVMLDDASDPAETGTMRGAIETIRVEVPGAGLP